MRWKLGALYWRLQSATQNRYRFRLTNASAPFVIVSDASPTGMCATLYHPVTGVLAAWGEFKFPYDRYVRAQYQGNREYLGHLFAIIVLIAYTPAHTTTRQYMWINDNIGAL